MEDLCHTRVSHKWQNHLDARAKKTRQPRLNGFVHCRLCGLFLDSQVEHGETCSTAEATRGHCACVHAVSGGVKLADPGITTEPRELTETQSRPGDLVSTAAFAGRSATLDVCGASPTQQQPKETQRRRRLIANCLIGDGKCQTFGRVQGIVYRPLVWTADDRPHQAVTRTLQNAADIAACRNGQQMSAKSLWLRWKHENPSDPPPTKSSHDTGSSSPASQTEPPATGSELLHLPSPANKLQRSSSQTHDRCSPVPLGLLAP